VREAAWDDPSSIATTIVPLGTLISVLEDINNQDMHMDKVMDLCRALLHEAMVGVLGNVVAGLTHIALQVIEGKISLAELNSKFHDVGVGTGPLFQVAGLLLNSSAVMEQWFKTHGPDIDTLGFLAGSTKLMMTVSKLTTQTEEIGVSKDDALTFNQQVSDIFDPKYIDELTQNIDKTLVDGIKCWFTKLQTNSDSFSNKAAEQMRSSIMHELQGLVVGVKNMLGGALLFRIHSPMPPIDDTRLDSWDIQPEYSMKLMELAKTSGDTKLQGQLSFVFAVQKIVMSAILAVRRLQASTSWDARQVTDSVAKIVGILRSDLMSFRRFVAGCEPASLFQCATGSLNFHVGCLDGLWEGDVIVLNLENDIKMLFAQFSSMWTDDLKLMTDKMVSMIPENWQLKKDELCSNNVLLMAMLSNKNIKPLSDISIIAHSVREHILNIHKQAPEVGKMVEADVLKQVETTVHNSVETVAISFALFSLTMDVCKEKNINVRKKKLDDMQRALKAKGVTMGADMVKRVQELSSATYVPPAPAPAPVE
jgi:hypothetical protein